MDSGNINEQLNRLLTEFIDINSNRCNQSLPFMVFGSGQPYTLNYNLPDSSSFTVKGFLPVTATKSQFKPVVEPPPVYNPWQTMVAENNSVAIYNAIVQLIAQTTNGSGLMAAFNAGKIFVTTPADFSTTAVINPENLGIIILALQTHVYNYNFTNQTPQGPNGIEPLKVIDGDTSLNYILSLKNRLEDFLFLMNEVYQNLFNNLVPSLSTNASGVVSIVYTYTQAPTPTNTSGINPQLCIMLTFKVTNYLGNYGAGKTVKTLSLLPGEKTNISLKTYRSSETVDSRVDNVLDSFTSKSLDSLEKFLEQENSTTKTKSGGGGLSLSTPVFSLGGGFKSQTTNMSKTINRALTKHVDESQNLRNVEVKTETKSTAKEGEETAIIREIANINKSRVLNFTFRQLNQEYTSVTYVEDAGISFNNGNDKDFDSCTLAEMDDFLNKYLNASEVAGIKNRIIAMLSSFQHYSTNTNVSFIEKITHTLQTLNSAGTALVNYQENGQDVVQTYYAKKKDLFTTVTINSTGATVQVPGIVTQVEKHVLNTDSVIVDALLGQGEALDCYNTQLQQLNVLTEKLSYTEKVQKIEHIRDVVNNADEFHKAYNHKIDQDMLNALAK